jgi:hypothetical protein
MKGTWTETSSLKQWEYSLVCNPPSQSTARDPRCTEVEKRKSSQMSEKFEVLEKNEAQSTTRDPRSTEVEKIKSSQSSNKFKVPEKNEAALNQ